MKEFIVCSKIKVIKAIVSEEYPFKIKTIKVRVGGILGVEVEMSGEDWECITEYLSEKQAAAFLELYVKNEKLSISHEGFEEKLKYFCCYYEYFSKEDYSKEQAMASVFKSMFGIKEGAMKWVDLDKWGEDLGVNFIETDNFYMFNCYLP